MTLRRRVPWLLATMVLLVGCHHATRPSASNSSGSSTPSSSGSSSSNSDSSSHTHHWFFHDDTSKPQSSRYRDNNDSIPGGPPPDVSNLPEPIPKTEIRSLYGNKSPYSVLGHTYTVLPSAKGYVERGLASFYGSKFHGYKTSNLEDYDMYKFTAASKVLPLPSYARVTNLQNGRSVVVRINDRGPFHEGRIVDLSYAAAVKIGVWPSGTGMVEVRGIDPNAPDDGPPAPPLPISAPSSHVAIADTAGMHQGIYLQVGAFGDAANAAHLADQLRQANFAPVQVEDVTIDGHVVHRVRVGPLADVDSADKVSEQIEQMGLPKPKVAVN